MCKLNTTLMCSWIPWTTKTRVFCISWVICIYFLLIFRYNELHEYNPEGNFWHIIYACILKGKHCYVLASWTSLEYTTSRFSGLVKLWRITLRWLSHPFFPQLATSLRNTSAGHLIALYGKCPTASDLLDFMS